VNSVMRFVGGFNRSLTIGIVLATSFFCVLAAMLLPVWDGSNFFKYADNRFNELSKGSVYFVPEIVEKAKKYRGVSLDVKIKMENAEIAERIAILYSNAGADAEAVGSDVVIGGDLGEVIENALRDAELGYRNELDGKEPLYYWWISLKEVAKHYKQSGEFDKALFIEDEVLTKAIEPAYNFYGIEAKLAEEEPLFVSGLLIFYVIYTIWWGFAIFFLFEGLGLRMEGAREKREV